MIDYSSQAFPHTCSQEAIWQLAGIVICHSYNTVSVTLTHFDVHEFATKQCAFVMSLHDL